MISDSTFRALLRKWKHARLTRDEGTLGYPTINILHPEHGVAEGELEYDRDVDVFQSCVDRLLPELRAVFEAFHLGVVHGVYCRQIPHRVRCHRLRIGEPLYKTRERSASEIIRSQLLTDFSI